MWFLDSFPAMMGFTRLPKISQKQLLNCITIWSKSLDSVWMPKLLLHIVIQLLNCITIWSKSFGIHTESRLFLRTINSFLLVFNKIYPKICTIGQKKRGWWLPSFLDSQIESGVLTKTIKPVVFPELAIYHTQHNPILVERHMQKVLTTGC